MHDDHTARTAGTATARFADVVASLDEALDVFADQTLDDMGVVAIGERLVAQTTEINRLEAARMRTLRAFLERRVWEADGYTGPGQWLRDRCRLSLKDAGRLVDTAEGLGMLPEARRAFEGGEISRDHAEVLAGTLKELAPEGVEQGGIAQTAEVAAEIDDDLLTAAKQMDPQVLGRAAKKKREEHGPRQDPTVEARRRFASRRFRSWRQDGMYAFDGLLPIVEGEKLDVVLNALRKPDPADTPEGMRRSFQQANADALAELAELGLRTGDLSDAGGVRPNVSVIVDWNTLLDSVSDPELRAEAEAATAGSDSSAANGSRPETMDAKGAVDGGGARPDGMARLGFAGEVDASLIGRLLCDASIARIVTGPDGLPLEAGEACPTVPAPLRRAVVARDLHCRAPGCDRPAVWCEVHHVVWQRFGGKTKLTVLVLLCTRHHHYVHDQGWKLDLREDGSCLWTSPVTGERFLTRPGDPTSHRYTRDDGVAIVAHGSLPSGADPRNTDDVRDPRYPATPNGTRAGYRTAPDVRSVFARNGPATYDPPGSQTSRPEPERPSPVQEALVDVAGPAPPG